MGVLVWKAQSLLPTKEPKGGCGGLGPRRLWASGQPDAGSLFVPITKPSWAFSSGRTGGWDEGTEGAMEAQEKEGIVSAPHPYHMHTHVHTEHWGLRGFQGPGLGLVL